MQKSITKSAKETQKLGAEFAQQILRRGHEKSATVLALIGDLGSGKTTFLQGFAKGLGIEEVVNSPTFIIMKKFKILGSPTPHHFRNFYHLDLYRLEGQKDSKFFNFKEIMADPKNIVAIEWPEKIAKTLPKKVVSISFNHLKENEREIVV